jgi:hypothetical protein
LISRNATFINFEGEKNGNKQRMFWSEQRVKNDKFSHQLRSQISIVAFFQESGIFFAILSLDSTSRRRHGGVTAASRRRHGGVTASHNVA